MALDMKLRELPVDEWSRLAEWPIYGLLPFADPQFARVFVVEDDAQTIIGVQGVFSWLHAEGLGVAPEHQGKTAVARLLHHAVFECLGTATGVMTAANTPEMEAMIRKMGGIELPVKPFYLPLKPLSSGVESNVTSEGS